MHRLLTPTLTTFQELWFKKKKKVYTQHDGYDMWTVKTKCTDIKNLNVFAMWFIFKLKQTKRT